MKKNYTLTAVVEREGGGYVALCPELDVASQGNTVEEAGANLKEAVELFLECASPEELTLLSIIRQSGVPRTAFEV